MSSGSSCLVNSSIWNIKMKFFGSFYKFGKKTSFHLTKSPSFTWSSNRLPNNIEGSLNFFTFRFWLYPNMAKLPYRWSLFQLHHKVGKRRKNTLLMMCHTTPYKNKLFVDTSLNGSSLVCNWHH
jgi:hypothetical protein